jgi:hypothetical protein
VPLPERTVTRAGSRFAIRAPQCGLSGCDVRAVRFRRGGPARQDARHVPSIDRLPLVPRRVVDRLSHCDGDCRGSDPNVTVSPPAPGGATVGGAAASGTATDGVATGGVSQAAGREFRPDWA